MIHTFGGQLAMFGRKDNINQRPEQVHLDQIDIKTKDNSRREKWQTQPWLELGLLWKVQENKWQLLPSKKFLKALLSFRDS